MSESCAPKTGLPVFRGTPEDFEYLAVDIANHAAIEREYSGHKSQFPFEAQLPQVIGYVPDGEIGAFTTYNTDPITTKKPKGSERSSVLDAVGKRLPGILSIIDADLRTISEDELSLQSEKVCAEIDLSTIVERARPQGHWHTDSNNTWEVPLFYIVSNTIPTEFYSGDATLRVPFGQNYFIDRKSLSGGVSVPAEPLAIVRMNPLSIHRAPTIERACTRTFFRLKVVDQPS